MNIAKYHSLMKFTLISILIISLSSPISTTAAEERELEVGVYDDYVEILSYFENETLSTEFEIRSDTQGGEGHLAIEMEYRMESTSGENSTEFEFEMEIVYHDLIEFVDENTDGKYDTDDTIVKTIPLGDEGVVYYEAPKAVAKTIGGINGHEITLKGNIDGVELTISMEIYTSEVTVDEVNLNPTQVKITIQIANFTFDEEASLLALKSEVRTETSLEVEIEGEDSVEINSEIGSGSYTISNTASVNGVDQNVGISTIKDSGVFMYSAYPQGNIVHDPVLGFVAAPVSTESNGSFLTANFLLISIFVVIPVSMMIMKKTKR